MKNKHYLIPFLLLLVLAGCRKEPVALNQSVNPVLGDISFVSKFGYSPDAATDENLRIRTHLEYVETLLRQKDVSSLSPDMQRNREHMLALLHEYREAGVFPRNYDYADQRIPCFIDQDGRICAVGYLVEMTAGRDVAEAINSKHKYEKLLAMNDATVDSWISTSGLTKRECAMIQPAYGFYPPPQNNTIAPAYGISSAILGGVNASMMTLNGVQIGRGSNDKIIPIIGMATGLGQITLGAALFPGETTDLNGNLVTNDSERALSYVNIGMGTSTLILSTWNLLADYSHPKKRSTSWSIYGFPTPDNSAAVGFYFSKRF
jgi:hypothetical protein